MAKLTERRMEKADHIFEEYRTKLNEHQQVNCAQMEKELKQCFNLGYQGIKDIIIDLFARERYKQLAAFFMENIDTSVGVVSEYHKPLAKLYGIKSYYADDREEKRKAFWDDFFSRQAAGGK